MATLKNTTVPNDSAFKVPTGTTAQRPAASQGRTFLNTDTGDLEVSNGSVWVVQRTTETNNNPTVVEFNSPGTFTWTVPDGISSVELLIVAGGGSGGSGTAGGGGAGGIISMSNFPVQEGQNIPVRVGVGGTPVGQNGGFGNNGEPSFFGQLSAIGGGRGASAFPGRQGPSDSGGSGGGGAQYPSGSFPSGSGTQPTQESFAGIYGFGNPGSPGTLGGGGGAGFRGGWPGPDSSGTNKGGRGRADSITGTPVLRGGGGSGQAQYPAPGQSGGPGGGGGTSGATGLAATIATGGGGGGGWDYGSGVSGAGAPGVVIISF